MPIVFFIFVHLSKFFYVDVHLKFLCGLYYCLDSWTSCNTTYFQGHIRCVSNTEYVGGVYGEVGWIDIQ